MASSMHSAQSIPFVLYSQVQSYHCPVTQGQERAQNKTRQETNMTGTIELNSTLDIHNLAKNVYETSHLIHAQISLECQQSITTRHSDSVRPLVVHSTRPPVHTHATEMLGDNNSNSSQDLGKALAHLQNATGVTRSPTWTKL
jgi:hypothetical protein